jgi:hypothetical protein
MTFVMAFVAALSAVDPSSSPSPTGTITADTGPTFASTYLLVIVIVISITTWWFIRTRNGRSPHGPSGQD